MTYRHATVADCPLLGRLNHLLIADEGHRNAMDETALAERMRDWLSRDYRAIIFEIGGEVVAYALYRPDPEEIYLRHFFVARNRRRQGIGREAIALLRGRIWPKAKRLSVSVLTQNEAAVAFWRALGYKDYCLTLEITQ